MHGVIDGKPTTDDIGQITSQQWGQVNVDFANGVMSAVCVVVEHSINLNKKQRIQSIIYFLITSPKLFSPLILIGK